MTTSPDRRESLLTMLAEPVLAEPVLAEPVLAEPDTAVTVVPGTTGDENKPGAFTVLVRDRDGRAVELGGPRESLFRVLRTAQVMLRDYCEAEHVNGYHADPEPGCPHCESDASIPAAESSVDSQSAAEDVAGLVHLLVRSGGYAAVHTPGTGVVDIYDDASAWDYGAPCLASFGLVDPAAPTLSAIAATFTAWLRQNPDRAAAANGPTDPTAHYVVRHGDFAVIGTPASGVIEIHQDVTVWNDGADPRHSTTAPTDQPFTADTVATVTQQWWLETAED